MEIYGRNYLLRKTRESLSIPILIGMPHAGSHIPKLIASRMTPDGLNQPDVALHVERLMEFCQNINVLTIASTISRYVVDLNRSPDSLNRHSTARHTSLCPLERFDGQPIYQPGFVLSGAEISRRVESFWVPYHDKILSILHEFKRRFGIGILIDIHTIGSIVPRFYDGLSPDISVRTGDGMCADQSIIDYIEEEISSQGNYTYEIDGRYIGGYIVHEYGRVGENLHSIQMEICQSTFMDEKTLMFDPVKALQVQSLIERLIVGISERSCLMRG